MDTKEVIRSRNLKRDRQHNVQKEKDNGSINIKKNTKGLAKQSHTKQGWTDVLRMSSCSTTGILCLATVVKHSVASNERGEKTGLRLKKHYSSYICIYVDASHLKLSQI
jgi:hypothetical protein